MPIPAAQVLVALIAHISGPLMLFHEPASPMHVSIADHVAKVTRGQTVRYEVTVSNPSTSETPVMVKMTLSPAVLHAIEADNAAVVANAVAWKNLLNPGETRIYTVAGVLDSKVDTSDLAATACVHANADSPALTCATDLDVVAPFPSNGRWIMWSAAVALGLFAAAASIWLQRRITPPLLTPLNASEGL
jgi:hypothetical protein